MTRKLLVSIPEYYEKSSTVLPPQNFEDMVERLNRPGGYWRVCTVDKKTDEILIEQWIQNAYTDNGVGVMFKALAGASTPSTAPGSYIAIDQSLGSTSLTASIASGGTVTSISVAAPTGPSIPSGSKLVINPGTANTLTVVTTQAITTAATITVNSVTGPASTIASGSTIRYDYNSIATTDVSSLSAPVSYTASLPSGQFSYTLTTGYGNRTLQITNNGAYLFSTTGSPVATAASYTAAWLTNASPVASTANTFVHAPFDAPLVINSTSNGLVTIVEKL